MANKDTILIKWGPYFYAAFHLYCNYNIGQQSEDSPNHRQTAHTAGSGKRRKR